MQQNRKEIETIARVRGLNHEALRMIKKIKALEEPEEGVFRDCILVNYERMRMVNYERMRMAMERVGLLLEVRFTPKTVTLGSIYIRRWSMTWIFWKNKSPSWTP